MIVSNQWSEWINWKFSFYLLTLEQIYFEQILKIIMDKFVKIKIIKNMLLSALQYYRLQNAFG